MTDRIQEQLHVYVFICRMLDCQVHMVDQDLGSSNFWLLRSPVSVSVISYIRLKSDKPVFHVCYFLICLHS